MNNLIIQLEDDYMTRMLFKNYAKKHGLELIQFENPVEANEANKYAEAKAIISDFDMPGETALSMLRFLHDNDIQTPVIMNSGISSNYDKIREKGLDKNIIAWKDKLTPTKEIFDIIEKL